MPQPAGLRDRAVRCRGLALPWPRGPSRTLGCLSYHRNRCPGTPPTCSAAATRPRCAPQHTILGPNGTVTAGQCRRPCLAEIGEGMNERPHAGLTPSDKMPLDPGELPGPSQRRPQEVVTGLGRALRGLLQRAHLGREPPSPTATQAAQPLPPSGGLPRPPRPPRAAAHACDLRDAAWWSGRSCI